MPYELKVGEFTGPLDALLELIEARKLEISEVSLAQVTNDFLRYLEKLQVNIPREEGDAVSYLRLLADFIVVASRLILIKSKSLVPGAELSGEEEAEIKDLESRLKLYRAWKPAMAHVAALWAEQSNELSRPYFLHAGAFLGSEQAVFYPGKNVSVAALQAALAKIFETLERFAKENQVIKNQVISLEEKANAIVAELRKLNETSLRILSGAGSREELIVTFLALLHLAREQIIFLEQATGEGDIVVRKI